MELKRYWQIIIRNWWIVVLLTLVGVAAAYQYYKSHPPSWQATVSVEISQQLLPSTTPISGQSFSEAQLASQYVADNFTHAVVGNVFLTQVSKTLKQESNIDISADALKGMVTAKTQDRDLELTIAGGDSTQVVAVAHALATVFSDKQVVQSFSNNGDQNQPVIANVLDVPTSAGVNGGRNVLLAAIYAIVGFIAGIALTFLLAYLDDSVRAPREIEELLNIPLLAAIPSYRTSRDTITNAAPRRNSTNTDQREQTQVRG